MFRRVLRGEVVGKEVVSCRWSVVSIDDGANKIRFRDIKTYFDEYFAKSEWRIAKS